jgi:3-phenylpropionate/trans-cinnamate dioxygenase ferredoxin reductase subunit
MKRFGLVIVGGGLASARAIAAYREAGGEGEIALLSKDATLPYHRPPLSKDYLRGETRDAPLVEDEAFYDARDVEVMLEAPVVAVAPRERTLTTKDGVGYGYDRLLIATGAQPRRLSVPGLDLEGVFSLRTLADADAIRVAVTRAEHAVVVGGGFIGMEVAASLRMLDLGVTLVHRGTGLFEQFGSQQLSDELAALYRAKGVELLLEEEVAEFGGPRQLAFVTTKSGRRIDADIAVVGVGALPAVDFLHGSGLPLADGVVVNERYETGAPGIFAVGDVANFVDPLYRRRRRIEHWSNADYQGTDVGRVLAGRAGGYDTVSSFFSDIFDLELIVLGDVSRYDALITDGSLADRDLAVEYGHRGRLVGAVAVSPSDEIVARLDRRIAARAPAGAALVGERAVTATGG